MVLVTWSRPYQPGEGARFIESEGGHQGLSDPFRMSGLDVTRHIETTLLCHSKVVGCAPGFGAPWRQREGSGGAVKLQII